MLRLANESFDRSGFSSSLYNDVDNCQTGFVGIFEESHEVLDCINEGLGIDCITGLALVVNADLKRLYLVGNSG